MAEKTLVASLGTICSILCHHAESGQFYVRASMSVPKSDISSVVLREYAFGSSVPDLFAIVQGTHREAQETSRICMIADLWFAEEVVYFISSTKIRAYKKRYGYAGEHDSHQNMTVCRGQSSSVAAIPPSKIYTIFKEIQNQIESTKIEKHAGFLELTAPPLASGL